MSSLERSSQKRKGRGGLRDPVVAEVMFENDIEPDDIPHMVESEFDPEHPQNIRGSKRYILVRGYARHQQHESPTGCRRWWASAHSWCVIDLKKQRIIHSYGQYCKTCGGKSTPSFDEEAMRRMAEYACRTHLYRTGRLRGGQRRFPNMADLSGEREGHHDRLRCDMCKLLGHSCQSQGVADVQRPSTPSPLSSPESESPVELFDPTLMLGCSFCGATGHSYLSCSVRRHQQELEVRHLRTTRRTSSTGNTEANQFEQTPTPAVSLQATRQTPFTNYTEVNQPQQTQHTPSERPVSPANQFEETSRSHGATAPRNSRRVLNVSSPGDFNLQTTARLGLAAMRSAVSKVGTLLFRRRS